uniref:BZIP domain-containing protein n=1 Tax=Wuchereria bancrofti TaxID=6293 RepID=A0AAF5RY09_WUCBA
MDFGDSYCYLENNFDQFHPMNLLSPSDSVIDNLGLELNSQNNNGVFVTDDSSIFDTIHQNFSDCNNGKSTSSHPMICIMPAATHSISVSSQSAANQDKQRIYHRNMKDATMFTPVNNLFNALSNGVAHYRRLEQSIKMNIHFVIGNYDRKKEDRKIRNRYFSDSEKNQIDEMKRNLANKDTIRKNEMLKSNANRNSNGRLMNLNDFRNLDPIPDATSFVALNFAKSNAYSSQNRINIGRALLSLDYDGSLKSNPLSQSNLNYSAKCDSILNNDVFAWINRHECLQFVHIRHIFRVPINGGLTTPSTTMKFVQDATTRKIRRRENRQRRTANDKMEATRLKAMHERTWRHIDMISSTADNTTIKSQNYYLLPATDRNSTMQPRIALILPALSFNAMMRLECDITGTGLFHLPSSFLPLFYDRSAHQ